MNLKKKISFTILLIGIAAATISHEPNKQVMQTIKNQYVSVGKLIFIRKVACTFPDSERKMLRKKTDAFVLKYYEDLFKEYSNFINLTNVPIRQKKAKRKIRDELFYSYKEVVKKITDVKDNYISKNLEILNRFYYSNKKLITPVVALFLSLKLENEYETQSDKTFKKAIIKAIAYAQIMTWRANKKYLFAKLHNMMPMIDSKYIAREIDFSLIPIKGIKSLTLFELESELKNARKPDILKGQFSQ